MNEMIERILLSNGLNVEVWDCSRTIAADTMKVELIIRIPVELKEAYFSEGAHFAKTRKVFGDVAVFEYRKERSFVHNQEREAVFTALLNAFKEYSLPYLAGEHFPRKFALSKYLQIEQHRYQYRHFFETPVPQPVEEEADGPCND